MKLKTSLGLVLLLLFHFSLHAQEEKEWTWEAGGYVKYLQSTTFYGIVDLAPTTNNLIHHRLNLSAENQNGWRIGIGMRNRLFFGEEVKLQANYADQIDPQLGLVDLSFRWIDDPAFVGQTIFDRAYLNYSKGDWDVTLGRQRINWGMTLVWNPNDLFNAFNYLDFDYEERPGSDAIRVQYFTGLLSRAEVAFSPARNMRESIGAGLYSFNLKGYDVQVLAGYFQGDLSLGAGWAGAIGGSGFKGELTYYVPTPSSISPRVFAGTLMLDQQFGTVYTSAAVLYNSRIISAEGVQGGIIGGQLSPKNLFPSKWAGFIQASWQASPIFTVSMGSLMGSQDKQVILLPGAAYSISENWDLDLVGQVFLGEFTEKFQHIGSGMFLRLKWSY
ncbi:MAG: hypothetical protein AAF388_09025 [Bacteroidota bacterium]